MKFVVCVVVLCYFSRVVWCISFNGTYATLSSFFDQYFGEEKMQEHEIGASAISILQDGEVIFFKGYGYEDFSKKIRTTEETVFGVGSISNTFVATLLLRSLYEQNGNSEVVNLDICVNDYLPFETSDVIIGNYYSSEGRPKYKPEDGCITIRDLVTHGGGLDENTYDLGENDPGDSYSLIDDIRRNMPPRIRERGVVGSYSNYGVALLGLAIENSNIHQLTYEEYLDKYAFEALNMTDHAYYGYWEAVNSNSHVCSLDCVDKVTGDYSPCEGWDFQDFDFKPSSAVHLDSIGFQHWVRSLQLQNPNLLPTKSLWDELFTRNPFNIPSSNEPPSFPSFIDTIFYNVPSWNINWIGHDGDEPPFSSELRLQRETGVGYALLLSKNYKRSEHFNFRRNLLSDFTRSFFDVDLTSICGTNGRMVDSNHHCIRTFRTNDVHQEPSDDFTKYTGCYVKTRFPHTSWLKLPSLEYLFHTSNFQNEDGSFCVSLTIYNQKTFLLITDTLDNSKFSSITSTSGYSKNPKMILLPKLYLSEYYPNSTENDFILANLMTSTSEFVEVEVDVTQGSDFLFLPPLSSSDGGSERKYWVTQTALGSFEYVSTSPKWYIFTYHFAFLFALLLFAAVTVIFLCVFCGACSTFTTLACGDDSDLDGCYSCPVFCCCLLCGVGKRGKMKKKKKRKSLFSNEEKTHLFREGDDENSMSVNLFNQTFGIQKNENESISNTVEELIARGGSSYSKYGIKNKGIIEKLSAGGADFAIVFCIIPLFSIVTAFLASVFFILHYTLIFYGVAGYYERTGRRTGLMNFAATLPLFGISMIFLNLVSMCGMCCYCACFGRKLGGEYKTNAFHACFCGCNFVILAILLVVCGVIYSLFASEFNVFLHT